MIKFYDIFDMTILYNSRFAKKWASIRKMRKYNNTLQTWKNNRQSNKK